MPTRPDQSRGFEQPEQKSESPTVNNILEGKAKIKFVSKRFDPREIGGKSWVGDAYVYEVTVPHPLKPGEEWTTELTAWEPAFNRQHQYTEDPKLQITISTGHGEMSLSGNQETIDKVYNEINRQVSGRT